MKVQEEKVTAVVTAIQGGRSEQWSELYQLLKKHKQTTVNLLKRGKLNCHSLHDIDAFYDDMLMQAVTEFDSGLTANFVQFFWSRLRLRATNFYQTAITKQAIAERQSGEFDRVAEDVYSKRERETGNICWEMQVMDMVDATHYLQAFEQYSKKGNRQKINAHLILTAANTMGMQDKDRQAEFLKVLPEGTTWASARKKLQRAREDFAVFYKNFDKKCHS